jgi:geranylgeranyl reductase family protein
MVDVVVIGAGPGGSATAHFLAKSGLQVQLLDKSEFPRDKTCGDGLTPRALRLLDEIGVLEQASQKGFRMLEATVFAPNGQAVTTQVPQRPDVPDHLLAVPRMELDALIHERALASGARFHGGVHVTGVESQGKWVEVTGRRNKRSYKARGRMVVIAVGASVALLLRLGILKQVPQMILASRTYFQDIEHLSGRFEFYFEGIPLPGYGWVFPLSKSSANVGTGIYGRRQERATNAKKALAGFLQLPAIEHMLASARQVGPVKGFPLRADFASAPTFGERLLLVGEAAGLVNPLTGEGVDYALESGKIAATHLEEMFTLGDFSAAIHAAYDRRLRIRFQRLFVFSGRIRRWYLNKWVLNRLVRAANRQPELRVLFTNIVLGNADAADGLSPKTVAQILFAR